MNVSLIRCHFWSHFGDGDGGHITSSLLFTCGVALDIGDPITPSLIYTYIGTRFMHVAVQLLNETLYHDVAMMQ